MFLRLYTDEDVDVRIAKMVQARGFDVLTTRDAANLELSDDEQLAFAVANARTLLTHNRTDFEQQARSYFTEGRTHCGIIIAVRRPPAEIVRRLLVIFDQVTADEILNQVRYI